MAKKLTQRKTSKVVVDFYLQSDKRVKDIPPEILKSLVADYKERERKHLSTMPDKKWHDLYWFDKSGEIIPRDPTLGIIGGYGVYDSEYLKKPEAWRDRDMDIARYVFALELAERSENDPGAFVFDKAFSKAQGSNRKGEARQPDIDRDGLRKLAQKKGYFDLPKNSRKKSGVLDSLISELGVYRDNRATSKASQHRHLKRILET